MDLYETLGLKRPTKEEMEMHHVATIGDLEVNASEHLVNVKCDGEVILAIMRHDGGLQELVDALQSQVKP
jgi:hypothetical protein